MAALDQVDVTKRFVGCGDDFEFPKGDAFDPSQERDENGRWTSGGGAAASFASVERAAAATKDAQLATIHAESHRQGDHDAVQRETRAAGLHETAAKAQREAGNDRAAAMHELRGSQHRETAESIHTNLTASQAESAAAKPIPGARVWTDKLPDGMQAETWQGHYDKNPDQGGKPNEERQRDVHDPIIHEALNVKPAGADEQKIAIMTMGAPASGKSSALRGVDTSKFVKVDPDAIKERLPEYQRAIADRDNTYRGAAAMAHEESSAIAKTIMAKAVENGNHIIVDGTGSNAAAFEKKMATLQAAGYHVHVAMPHLEEHEGIQRLNDRADKSGRMVPEKFARQAYRTIPQNFERIAHKADSFALYDNSGKEPHAVWEGSKKGGDKIRDPAFVSTFRDKYGHADGGDWDEEKHPRAKDGTFGGGSGEGGGSSAQDPVGREVGPSGPVTEPTKYGDWKETSYSFGANAGETKLKTLEIGDGHRLLGPDGPGGGGYVAVRDHLLDRMGDLKAPPGQAIVYRVGADDGLSNRNAGSMETIVHFLDGYAGKFNTGSSLTAYAVKLPSSFAPYQQMLSGKKRSADGDWDESKHPRAANGKFGEGSGESGGSSPGAPTHPAETARQIAIQVLRAGAVRDYKGIDQADALAALAPVTDKKTARAAGTVLYSAVEAAAHAGVRGYAALTAVQNAIESVTYGASSEPGLAKAVTHAAAAGIPILPPGT